MKKTCYITLIVLFIFAFHSSAQIITTIVGNGAYGYTPDGAPGTATQIIAPVSVCVDAAGNVLFADNDFTIRELTASGLVRTIAGYYDSVGYTGDGGPATAAKLFGPVGVANDAFGNLYFAEKDNGIVRKISASGIITTIAGNGSTTYSGDGGPATAAGFYTPNEVAVDVVGNIYVSDMNNFCIRKTNTSGIISTIAGMATGTWGFGGDGGPATMANMGHPGGIHFDGAGNLYITDGDNARIRKVDTYGIITTVAGSGMSGYGGDGNAATNAKLNHPTSLTVDEIGNIYIADYGNARIRKVNTSGIITTIAGTGSVGFSGDFGPATAATLNAPTAVALDSVGNVIIADYDNFSIRRILYSLFPLSGATSVCVGASVVLTEQIAGGTWSSSSPSIATVGSATGNVSGIATGSVVITYSFGGLTEIKNITVDALPNAGTITSVNSPSDIDTFCYGADLTNISGMPGGIWGLTNSSVATISGTGIVSPVTFNQLDTAVYTISNSCGADTAFFRFVIEWCPDYVKTIAGNAESVSIYPNPNTGVFTLLIKSDIDEHAAITITNIMGEKVKECSSATNIPTDIQLDVAAGVYYLNVNTSAGKWNEKLIISMK